jgi:hypothetical protein
MDALFPITDRAYVYAEQLCQVGLKEVFLEPFMLHVLADSPRFDREGLFAAPAARVWGL